MSMTSPVAYFKAPLVGAIAVELREEGGAFKQGDTQVHAEPWLPSRKGQFQHRYPLRERHPGNGSRETTSSSGSSALAWLRALGS